MGYEPNELPLLHPAAPSGVSNQTRFVPPILFKPSSVSNQVSPDLAAPGLPGVTRPHRHRCDETENPGRNQLPGPLALLPVARSPSRPCHHDRWWALAPPVRPLPVLPRCTGGNTFCCGCSQDAALAGLPPLTVSWGDPALLPIRLADIRDAGPEVGKFL